MENKKLNETPKQPVASQPASVTTHAAVGVPNKGTEKVCVKLYDLDPQKIKPINSKLWENSPLTQLEAKP